MHGPTPSRICQCYARPSRVVVLDVVGAVLVVVTGLMATAAPRAWLDLLTSHPHLTVVDKACCLVEARPRVRGWGEERKEEVAVMVAQREELARTEREACA
ncbi:hypothetical protein EJB05_28209, partial [Eragrostis curvula]